MRISRRTYRHDARGIKRRAIVEALEKRKLLAAAGLVAAYAFDEGAGSAAADASGTGNTGTISNATWTAAGKFGSALSFNGTNAVVNVADSASLDLTGGMTLEAWVRPTSQSGYRTVMMKDVPGELAYALYGSGDVNRPNTWTRMGSTSYDATGPAALPLNTWSHLAATYNGTTLLLYVNGAQVASRSIAGVIQTSANPFHVGGNPVWREYWAGSIDEVRVYNRALSAAEVRTDMNAPVGAPAAPDTAAPTVSLSAPAVGSSVSGSVQVSAAAGDNVGVAGVQFKLDGVNLGAEDTAAPYAVTWNADAASLGGHTLAAVARDAAGNSTTSSAVGVTVVDVTAPTAAVTAPAPGATVAGSVTVMASASDGRAVAGVQFLLDGNPLGAEDTAAPYSLAWNSATASDGPHVLSAAARDAMGNLGTSAAVSVTVKNADTVAPAVSVTAPADGATVSGTQSVSAAASDDVAVAGIQFLLDGQMLGPEDTAAPYAVSWDTTGASDARHVLTARARDAAGNVTTSAGVGVMVYNGGRLVIDSPSAGASVPAGTVGLTYHIAGNLSGYDHVCFTLDNGAELADAPADGTFAFGAVAPGTHLINGWLVRADGSAIAGSASPALTITSLAPDNQAPAVSITSPAANATVSATLTLAATATDSAGVTGVQFQLDGVSLGAADTAAPYSVSWNTATAPNGLHVLTAVATDTAGNTSSDSRTITVSNGVNLTINGSVRYQTIDGLGVNLGATAWNGGQVKPWIDTLVSEMGASLFRVIIEPVSGWEDTNDNADPFTPDWDYYNTLYATPKFTDLWNTIAYLNTKNVHVLLNVMGTVPAWMGGTVINASAEDEFVEMETSMLYYGVNTAHVHVDDFSILNEQDIGTPEGPNVNATQYARLVNRVVSRMVGMGLTDIGIVGGETANGSTSYNDVLYADATVMPYVKHLAFHNYYGSNGSFDSDVKNSGWPNRNWWVTEYADAFFSGDDGTPVPNEWTFSRNSFQNLMNHVSGGASGVAVYDGIDALYQHHNFHVNSLGQIGWNPTTNVYSIRKRFYANGMLYKFVRPGAVRIGSSTTRSGLVQVAFYNPASGQISIVGRNSNSTPVTIVGSLGGGVAGSVFQLFQTDSGPLNMTRGPDVRISGGQYSVTIPADTIFALATPTDLVPPSTPTGLTVASSVGSASLQWDPATDDVGVTGYNVYRSTSSGFTPSAANLVGRPTGTTFTDVVPAGTYYYVVVAVDGGGNQSPASSEVGAVVAADTTAPAVALTAPASGAAVTGTVTFTATASDEVGVSGVQFLLDGSPVGAEDTVAPYSLAWNSALTVNGDHTVAARARDAAGNIMTSTVATVTVSNAPAVPGLVAYYSFNEGAGSSAGDSSGKGNNGTIVGAAWTAAGKYGSALVFNGAGNVVNVPDSNSLDLTTGMTIEAWVRPSALGGYRTVVMKDLPSELSYALYASGDTSRPGVWGRVNGTTGASPSAVGTAAVPLNAWTHLAATYNGSALVLYVNGAQAATRALTGALLTSANPLHIGGNAVWGEYFAGAIDEVRVYNVALTAAQIQADMNAAAAPGGAPSGSLTLAGGTATMLTLAAPTDPLVSVDDSAATADLSSASGARALLTN